MPNAIAKLMSKRLGGIPVPVLAVGAGAAVWWFTSAGGGTGDVATEGTGEEPMVPGDSGAGFADPAFDPVSAGPGITNYYITNEAAAGAGVRHRCPPGFVWSSARKKCVRRRRRCPQGQKWSTSKRRCVPIRTVQTQRRVNGRATSRVQTTTARALAARRR